MSTSFVYVQDGVAIPSNILFDHFRKVHGIVNLADSCKHNIRLNLYRLNSAYCLRETDMPPVSDITCLLRCPPVLLHSENAMC